MGGTRWIGRYNTVVYELDTESDQVRQIAVTQCEQVRQKAVGSQLLEFVSHENASASLGDNKSIIALVARSFDSKPHLIKYTKGAKELKIIKTFEF